MTLSRTSALALLGVDPTASPNEITRAYHRLAREVHPDRCGSADAAERFAHLSDAYQRAIETVPEPAALAPVMAPASRLDPRLRTGDAYLRREPGRQTTIVPGPVSVTPPRREPR